MLVRYSPFHSVRTDAGTVARHPASCPGTLPGVAQDVQGAHSQHGVLRLIKSFKGNLQFQTSAVLHPCVNGQALFAYLLHMKIIPSHRVSGCSPAESKALQYGGNLRLPVVKYKRNAGLDDAGLLPRNLGQGVAQILGMVHADGGNHTGRRPFQHIGDIQPAAHTGFQNHHIHITHSEQNHSHIKQKFKKSGMAESLVRKLPAGLKDSLKSPFKAFLVHHPSINQETFTHLHQMRRDEGTGAVSGLL